MSASESDVSTEAGEAASAFPVWKKMLLALAAASVVTGVTLKAVATDPDPTGPEDSASIVGAVHSDTARPLSGAEGFAQSDSTQTTSEQAVPVESTSESGSPASDWSPFFIKGGFSFFVGFCLGYAMRAFFKISAVAFGFLFLLLFVLAYAGVIEVNWTTMEEHYDSAVALLKDEFTEFKTFITGSLPAAGLAGVGLVAGFKRK